MDRRRFLALLLGGLATPARLAAVESQPGRFEAEVAILYGLLTLRLTGTIDEVKDRAAGRYAVTVRGEGTDIVHALESTGLWRDGRWAPLRTISFFNVRGRESRVEVTFDYERRIAEYHGRSETFLLRRVRVADDRLALPADRRVDDVTSAILNYADGTWPFEPDGTLLTHIVRRQKPVGERPDDVERRYRAELVPFVLKPIPDAATGRATALFDLTRFSSWAREDRPARIVFDPRRRPEAITSSLMLGTSVTIRIAAA